MAPHIIAVNAFMKPRGKATLSAIVKGPNMRGKNIIAPFLIVPNRTRGNAISRNTRDRILEQPLIHNMFSLLLSYRLPSGAGRHVHPTALLCQSNSLCV